MDYYIYGRATIIFIIYDLPAADDAFGFTAKRLHFAISARRAILPLPSICYNADFSRRCMDAMRLAALCAARDAARKAMRSLPPFIFITLSFRAYVLTSFIDTKEDGAAAGAEVIYGVLMMIRRLISAGDDLLPVMYLLFIIYSGQ